MKNFAPILLLSILGGSMAIFPLELADRIAETTLGLSRDQKPLTAVPKLDTVTYTLVDTTLFLMQLGKNLMLLEGLPDPLGPFDFFGFTHNISRVQCGSGSACVKEDIYLECQEPTIGGLGSVHIYTDIQLDKLNLTLWVDEFTMGCPDYHHRITTNTTKDIRHGEVAYLALRNSTYGINADYKYVAGRGVVLSNVDITLRIGEETWTVEKRWTVKEDGEIVDDGFFEGDISQGVMNIWNGQHEGQQFETQYEQWAEFLLNCGLSGGSSDAACDDAKDQVNKLKSMLKKQK